MYVQQFFTNGLGCASYLIGCEAEGVAAVIDPDQNVQQYLEAAAERGLRISHIIETHLHADHVSGNIDLAQRTGAEVYLHEAAGAEFEHRPTRDGDMLALGNIRLTVVHTPGHTPESISLLVSDLTRSEEPWMLFSGDTLFVGDIGRPDLTGQNASHALAGQLYSSIFDKIMPMADSLLIYPGHGAGSLCGRGIGSVRSTTLGYEKQTNPAMQERSKDDFVHYMTHDLPEQPGNHQRIKAVNKRGPLPLGDIRPQPLTIMEALPHFRRGAALLDTRSKEQYVTLHAPGSVHLPNDEQLSNRIGFVLSPDVPVVLLLASPEEYAEVVLRLARVGYTNVVGYLSEGITGWQQAGLPVASGDIRDLPPGELHHLLVNGNGSRPVVLDVREPWEYDRGHVPEAVLIPLGQLSRRVSELDPSRPVAVICATGNRSQSAAALLAQKGFETIYNVTSGMMGWQMAGLEMSRN